MNATILFVLGAVASVLLPYLREWLDSKEAFDWRKLVGQFIAVLATVASQIVGLVDMLDQATLAEAFFIGWGVSNIGRFGQKVYDSIKR